MTNDNTRHTPEGLAKRLRDYAANGSRPWQGIEAVFTDAADEIEKLASENKRLLSHVVRIVMERDDLKLSLGEILPLSCEYSCERDGTGSGTIAVHSDVCERARAAILKATGGGK